MEGQEENYIKALADTTNNKNCHMKLTFLEYNAVTHCFLPICTVSVNLYNEKSYNLVNLQIDYNKFTY